MLILRGLLALRRFRMAFDLADDGQAVDDMPAAGQRDRAQILDLFFFQSACVGLLRFLSAFPGLCRAMQTRCSKKTVIFHEIFLRMI